LNQAGSELRRTSPAAAVEAVAVSAAADDLFREPGTGYFPKHTRAQVKVQEGCDFFCSYCIVPFARGRPRSRELDDVLREAGELLRHGHRELVLTGVNITTYHDHGRGLTELVRQLLKLPGDFRVRLGSTEPGPECRALLELMSAEPRLCRFLHLPLQYGEDSILRAMNRRYSVAEFAELIRLATTQAPGICLGTDVMVGFPGETDRAFAECLATIANLPLAYLHVFSYSPRPGTKAVDLPGRVPADIVATRHQLLADLGRTKSLAFAESAVGSAVRVLTEERNQAGLIEGWSDNYLRVELAAGSPETESELNQFVHARVTAATGPRRVRAEIC
jgi:threonylcarbamoyladenosine tRNA methylthiotransferase MtaB